MAPRRSISPPLRESDVRKNRRLWERTSESYERKHRRDLEKSGGLAWGLWRVPEEELRLLGPTRGRRVLELGCGAARWSLGLRRRGASPVGLDLSSEHLRHAQRALRRAGVAFPLLVADAERLPFRDRSFDIVFCDWGALSFTDPHRTVPEAARVLRPGGVLAFATASPLRFVSLDPRTERLRRALVRDYFGMHRVEFPNEVSFTLPYGRWVELFRAHGLAIERLIEPTGGPRRPSSYLTASERTWSGRYPLEILWGLRKAGGPKDGKPHPRPRSGLSDGRRAPGPRRLPRR